MCFRTRSGFLPFLVVSALCACSGQVERTYPDEDDSPDDEASPHPPLIGFPMMGDGDAGGGDAGGETGETGDGDVERPPTALGGAGGALLTPVDINHFCPTNEQWEMMFGQQPENLGGAANAEECPRLPSTSYSESYCVVTFASVEPIVLSESGSCCYHVEMLYCR